MPLDLLLVSILRTLVEVAGLALLGQGILAVLAGGQRDSNVLYRILQTITRPVVRAVRIATPRLAMDEHIPIITFFLLFWLWIALAVAKRMLCASHGLQC